MFGGPSTGSWRARRAQGSARAVATVGVGASGRRGALRVVSRDNLSRVSVRIPRLLDAPVVAADLVSPAHPSCSPPAPNLAPSGSPRGCRRFSEPHQAAPEPPRACGRRSRSPDLRPPYPLTRCRNTPEPPPRSPAIDRGASARSGAAKVLQAAGRGALGARTGSTVPSTPPLVGKEKREGGREKPAAPHRGW